jgi:hypothetical protein
MRIEDERYMLITEDGTQFIIQNGTLQKPEDTFGIDNDIIERSFIDGAIAPGESRGTAKELILNIAINNQSESVYRDTVNDLFYWCRKAVTIRDRKNNIETDIVINELPISYDEGGQHKGSTVSFVFTQLIPFWKDIDFIEVTENVSASNQLIIDNDGYYDTPAIFILQVEIPKFLIKMEETDLGIGINDLSFGKVNLQTYVIDNENGEALLSSVLRNDRIISGTGFFFLRRGTNTLNVTTWLNRDLDFTVRYKRRYFI